MTEGKIRAEKKLLHKIAGKGKLVWITVNMCRFCKKLWGYKRTIKIDNEKEYQEKTIAYQAVINKIVKRNGY